MHGTALDFLSPGAQRAQLSATQTFDNVDSAALNIVIPLHAESVAEAGNATVLRDCVARSVRRYLVDLDGTPCREGLYTLLMREVEAPLLNEVLGWCSGNQSRAAEALGINRATLRKKLLAHGLI